MTERLKKIPDGDLWLPYTCANTEHVNMNISHTYTHMYRCMHTFTLIYAHIFMHIQTTCIGAHW